VIAKDRKLKSYPRQRPWKIVWYIELHVGRNTKRNAELNHVFGKGGNIAVSTLAPYTCCLTVHCVKKLP